MKTAALAARPEAPPSPARGPGAPGLLVGLALFVCPLVFLTDLTRNPYFTQIALLNLLLLAAAAVLALRWARAGAWGLPRTPVDAPWLAWLAACALAWGLSYAGHASFFRDSMRAEGAKAFSFTIVNAMLPFYLALAVPSWSETRRAPAALWPFAVWGAAWALYPALRAQVAASTPSLAAHLFDPYGVALWIAGIVLALRTARRGGPDDYLQLALAVGLLAACYGILEYFNVEWIWSRALNPYGGRAVSTFGNPNFLSSYLVVLLPLALVRFVGASGARRWSHGALFLVFEASLLASLTRSSWVGAARSDWLAWKLGRPLGEPYGRFVLRSPP